MTAELEKGRVEPGPARESLPARRQDALAWASLAQRFPASSVLARDGAGCGSVGDVPGVYRPLWGRSRVLDLWEAGPHPRQGHPT